MTKSSIDSSALALILIGAGAAVLLVPAQFTFLTSILGLVLLVLLLSYDEEGYRSLAQSLAFAGVAAFCLTVASIIPYQFIYGLPTPREPQLINRWLPMTWVFATVLIFVIDRARMGARVQTAPVGAARLGSMILPVAASPVAGPAVAASPIFSQPAPVTPVMREDYPSPVHEAERPSPHLVSREPVAAPPPVKLVEIYVHLTGESLNLMRSVQAEPLGRDYYRIVDTMPENEMWQFVPGQVVRCKKQNLSTGKAMVAIEEAPRAN